MTPPWRTFPSPHIRPFEAGTEIDYNGTGRWSAEGIRSRYIESSQKLRQPTVADLFPRQESKGERAWIYPLMWQIIDRIEANDAAAIEIGLDMLEEEEFFVFGRLIKTNTARALRRVFLTEEQKERVRRRVVSMLLAGNVPREIREYKKLLRKVGVGERWPELDAGVDRGNWWVMRHYAYLDRFAREKG